MKRKLIFPIIIFVLSLCFILIFSFLGNKPRIANLGNIQFIEKNNNTYKYSLKLMEKDTIFKHSDLFYIYLNEKNLPDYIKEIIPIKKGHPNIQIISSEKLDTNKEYEAEYILKLKDEVYIISLMLCYLSILLIIIFYIKNINKRIILLYLSLLLLIIVNTFLSKLQLNYIEIFLLISFYILIILNDNNFQFFNLKIKHKNLLLVSTALFTAFAIVFIINFSYPNVGEDIRGIFFINIC